VQLAGLSVCFFDGIDPRSGAVGLVCRVNLFWLTQSTRGGHLDNFSERFDLASIRDEGKIYSACGDGKIPFIRWDLHFSTIAPLPPGS
jgi:hypothetical protein